MRVRIQVVNQPSGRPDADRVVDFPDDSTISPITQMLREGRAPVGTTICQTEGAYVRTWTLMEETS